MKRLLVLLLTIIILGSGCISTGSKEKTVKTLNPLPSFTATLLTGSTTYRYVLNVSNSSGDIKYTLLIIKGKNLNVKCPSNGSCLTGNWKGIEINIINGRVVSTFIIPPHSQVNLTNKLSEEYLGVPASQVPEWIEYHNPYLLIKSLLYNLSISKSGKYPLSSSTIEVLLKEGFGIFGKGLPGKSENGTLDVVFSNNNKINRVSIVIRGSKNYTFNLTTGIVKTSKKDYILVNGTRIYLSMLHFYMYGMKTCPHCRHMHELIPKLYGNSSLTYYELVDNEYNNELYEQLHQLIGVTGVPVIAITYNNTLWAVIEGEFNASATPQIVATAMKNQGVLLFIGGKWYILYYSKSQPRKYIKYLYTIFVKHEKVNLKTNENS